MATKENYKETQKFYRNMYKNRGKLVWLSKDPQNPVIKGRTYIKVKEEEKKNGSSS